MILEWIRRRDPAFDTQLRAYRFTEGLLVRPFRHQPGEAEAADAGGEPRVVEVHLAPIGGRIRVENPDDLRDGTLLAGAITRQS